ncbi:GNAT family N-acetyltransferase [Kribbella sandramycini]|uniref:GNAT family N-acetyltransferase n=1 Tax=Kribbella sandramycini TaxID=60450 RepID=A0A7Y4KYH0_9ACTN|nr:GNAT family N-acetyltransferase [Kribbella sandramycini]MBB6569170.1 GNAT superfamily N-acetyltransferase [Kribbella sandramycini]NOL40989.1 GNAT family N-acetyltransferase [Kribbella sandramycini]
MSIRLTPLTDPDHRPHSHRLAWLASDNGGHPVGSAFLRLHHREALAQLADVEINVHPAERGRGIGSLLLDAVIDTARDHDVRTLVAEVLDGAPAFWFAREHGFHVAVTLIYTRLDLAHAILDPAPLPPGYRLVSWAGVVPDELAQTFTDARSGMDDAPTGGLDYGAEIWDLDRTRQAAQVISQRGEHLLTTAAVYGDVVVGYTELVVPGDGKGEGQHYGTAVLPAHRSRGVARAIKTEQLRLARQEFPDLSATLTDTVDTNVPMRHLNALLGFLPTHTMHRCTLQVG